MIHFLSISVFPLLMIIAGAGDALSLRIPNWLTLTIFTAFFPLAFATGMPLDIFGLHLLTAVILFVLGFLLFSAGLFGGGDAKLMAAAGIWFGSAQALPFLIFTAMAGGILALCVGLWSIISMSWEIRDASWSKKLLGLRPNVPYGYAFAIGAILAFPQSWWMVASG
ncbi:MAG TPA: prepilin peptidase [Aestuariivirga sp.]|jgi:prepilin peptidase CpaA|nr:prepilin peptidase [Aestuariivirga sp.]